MFNSGSLHTEQIKKGDILYVKSQKEVQRMQLLKKLGFKSRKAKGMLSREKRLQEKRRIIIKTDPVNLDQLHIKKEVDPN